MAEQIGQKLFILESRIMKESEIRPKKIFDEYLRLAKQDTIDYFAGIERMDIDCPACGSQGEVSISKDNFEYCLCPDCKTLYVSPRPLEEAFAKYYIESPSSKYWADTFYKETADARREKIWNPKAALIADALKEHGVEDKVFVDIGGGYGIFAEVMQKYTSKPIEIIEPAPHLAKVCREKGFSVVQKFLESVEQNDLSDGEKVFVSFELFEHLYEPKKFLQTLYDLMNSGDIFVFTTLSGLGIDIQLLWENSKSVSPPHHLNFFNPKSVDVLLKSLGFKTLEVTTPGKLDVDILVNNKQYIKDPFWKNFLEIADEQIKSRWQELISQTGWSSHMMVICQKL